MNRLKNTLRPCRAVAECAHNLVLLVEGAIRRLATSATWPGCFYQPGHFVAVPDSILSGRSEVTRRRQSERLPHQSPCGAMSRHPFGWGFSCSSSLRFNESYRRRNRAAQAGVKVMGRFLGNLLSLSMGNPLDGTPVLGSAPQASRISYLQ